MDDESLKYHHKIASQLFAGDLYVTPEENYYIIGFKIGYENLGKRFVNLKTGYIVNSDTELYVRKVNGIISKHSFI